MRTKHFLTFAAITAALASCTSDDFDIKPGVGNGDFNGKLVEAGLLGMGRIDGAETRAMDNGGRFIWMPDILDTDGSIKGNSNQKIGFCWVGTNTDNPQYAAATQVGDIVFTNYLYEHVGWMDKAATGIGLTECLDEIQNGAFIVGQGDPEAQYDPSKGYIFGTNKDYSEGKYDKTSHKESTGTLHLGSGLFRTENSSVFEGDYLVYFPYTDRFTKGSILANVPNRFAVDLNSTELETGNEYEKYNNISKYSFAVGYVSNYAGGNEMEKIQTKNVNGYLNLILKNVDKEATTATAIDVTKVIYYSPSTGIIYENDLSSRKVITALQGDWNNLANEGLYAATNIKKTNSVYVDVTNGCIKETSNDIAKTMLRVVSIPALPQQIDDLEVYIVRKDQQSIKVEANVDINSGSSKSSTIDVNLYDYRNDWAYRFFAVDEISLREAVDKIETEGSSKSLNTIYLLRDIDIENVSKGFDDETSYTFNVNGKPTIVKSMYEMDAMGNGPAKIILKSEKALTLKSSESLTFAVDFIVEGRGCCENNPAILQIGAPSECNVVNFTETLTNNGSLAIYSKYHSHDGSNLHPAVEINKLVNEYDEWAVNKKKNTNVAKVIVASDGTGNDTWGVQITDFKNRGEFVTFEGTVSVGADNCIAPGIAQKAEKRYVKSLIKNVDNAQTKIGNTLAANSGTIILGKNTMITSEKVDNLTENSLIKINGDGSSSTTDARYDIYGASKNEGTIENFGVINFTGANLDNDGLVIDRVTGQLGGKFVNNGRGEQTNAVTKTFAHGTMVYKADLGTTGIYVVQVDNTLRLGHALKDAVLYPSSVIVEFIANDNTFNMESYANDLDGKDVIINAENITFESYKLVDGVKKSVKNSIGDCVTVKTNAKLFLDKYGIYTTTKDVFVERKAEFTANGVTTVGRNLNTKGITKNTSKLTVGQDFITSGTTTAQGTYIVNGNLKVAGGTFKSERDNNEVMKNFIQTAGASTFAPHTTTTIYETFNCTGGTFNRLALNGDPSSRATVNVTTLGDITGGSTDTAWPTELEK